MSIKLGCAGWDYLDWIGPFYPKKVKRPGFLQFYSHYFDLIELNSSFYNIPTEKNVRNWYVQVPQDFRFIVKVWKGITHKLGDDNNERDILHFFNTFKLLKEKVEAFLFQFPPWFKHSTDHEGKIKILLNEIPEVKNKKMIMELRDNSWFNSNEFLGFLGNRDTIIATTYMPNISAYYHPNQSSYYIRLIGDRQLTVFNRIQRSQEDSINDVLKNINKLKRNSNTHEIFIIVNNHFAGFAPETINLIKKKLDIPSTEFNSQRKLTDFF